MAYRTPLRIVIMAWPYEFNAMRACRPRQQAHYPVPIISPLAELAKTTYIAHNLTRQTPGSFLQFKEITTDGIIVIRIAENIHSRMVRWR